MKDLNSIIFDAGIVPILFAEDESVTERVVNAIEQTEIPVVEILQRGETAEKVLKEAIKIKKNSYIGAGTICNLEHCKRVVDLGADFIVTPGYNPEVVDWCVKNNIPVVPGVTNPSEIMMAVNAGIKLAKFFPFYQLGGEDFLNGISGPFPDIKFVITGSVDDRGLHYLSNHKIAAIGGIWPFQGEVDHTVISENNIVRRINLSIQIGRHFRQGW